MSKRNTLRWAALTGVVSLVTLATPSAGTADSRDTGSVKVLNTETVQVYLSPDGSVESKRVYEQLALTGHGTVNLANPVSTDGLRNLDGFSSFTVKNGDQITSTTVDGVQHLRSVSNYDKSLPVSVTPAYWLDGRKVQAGDIVGKSGHLQVQYTVTNTTAQRQLLTIPDGKGGTITKSVLVPVPLVGSLTTTTPKSFSNVVSGGANAAGDGAGGVTLSYTMTLFPPIGSTTTTVGYSADITDGVVPRVDVAMLPVDPLANPTFKSAAGSYQGGAKGGTDLVTGAAKIDTNLLKLRDGAASVLAGLIKLSAGADQLHSGLATSAVPGSKKLSDGTGAALAGAKDLKTGLGQISGGLSELSSQLPAVGPGIQQLIDGVNQISAGFGAVGQAGTLIDGLNLLNGGALALKAGLTGQLIPGVTAAKGGVDQVKAGLDAAIAAGGSIDQLIAGLNAVLGTDCGPICQGIISGSIIPGAQQSKTDLTAAAGGLGQVSTGLAQVLGGLNTQIVPGLDQLATGAADAKTGAQQLKAGNQQVHDGLVELKTKLAAAVAGVLQLNSGASSAYTGAGDLASGIGQLDSGAKQLSAGLSDAATGSGQIADGLHQAANGAPQLVDGAQQLSTQGMGALEKSGAATAQQYGELYAVIKAGSERAKSQSMAFGAPAGAEGLTAYAFTIDSANGATQHNLTRGVAAALLVSLGGAAFALRRRWA